MTIDGQQKQAAEGSILRELAPQGSVVARVNGTLVDLSAAVDTGLDGAAVEFLPPGSQEALHVLRHSAAHVMAQAVLRLFPDARYAIGPPVEDQFYYDFDLPRTLAVDDLESIEREMAAIASEDQPFVREEVPKERAISLFTDFDQRYKREILTGTDEQGQVKVGETATLYHNPPRFTDLCLGPHVPSTSWVKHVKLLRVSGAYWRGDESRPQLQRIYGTAWPTEGELKDYLDRLEEAEKRDHRRLGRELDLFSSPPEVGPGMYLWHPKGGLLRKLVEDFSRDEHLARGYDIVATPHTGRAVLWETSGHLEKFAENMFPVMQAEEGEYYLKPMNCPFHILIYASRTRSYRDLPLRYSELGTVYRHERSGTLQGLLRVRGMTQDDAHIFCRRDQLLDEIITVMDMTVDFYKVFGFSEPVVHLSTNPGKAIGTPQMWEEATDVLRQALEKSPFEYEVAEGEGAFYGPKIDFHFRDAVGRLRQCTTIQVDFALPERFGIEYVGADNSPHRPIMIHRALYGSVERFLGVLIEHTAGALPPWLSPVHVRVLPLKDEVNDAAEGIAGRLRDAGLRVEVDRATESLGYKIRRATLEKLPWMLIVGPREAQSGTVSVRYRGGAERKGVALEEFAHEAATAVASRAVEAGVPSGG
ncbi:MAG TPA: threonine--tRNA ligase [Actinomycetota bacterium]|nr:threonine--tRNA ligase [Actinomycetota bacterium]